MGMGSRKVRTRLNKSVILSSIFLVLIGFCVSRVKYEVVFLKSKLKEINRQLDKYQDDMRVYNAEWSYLNEPKRLQRLAAKYLPNLRPTENHQVINFETLTRSDFEKEFKENIDQVIEQHRHNGQNASRAFGSFLDEAIKKYGKGL